MTPPGFQDPGFDFELTYGADNDRLIGSFIPSVARAVPTTSRSQKLRRKAALLDAVDTMATEETYYWYAKCTRHPRAQRALRLLLAEESP